MHKDEFLVYTSNCVLPFTALNDGVSLIHKSSAAVGGQTKSRAVSTVAHADKPQYRTSGGTEQNWIPCTASSTCPVEGAGSALLETTAAEQKFYSDTLAGSLCVAEQSHQSTANCHLRRKKPRKFHIFGSTVHTGLLIGCPETLGLSVSSAAS